MEVKAYAKINLALEVMDEKNGYHMVNNLMILTDLYDTIILEKADDILLENNMIDDNIMIKAAKLFLDHFNISSGVHMKLIKRIPVAAGLAGGSTDAASVLKGLNSLYNVEASNEELMLLASKLGSDVPFFIDGSLALCTNRGEVVNKLDITPNKIPLVLIKINEGLSTKEVYKNYIYDNISKDDKIKNIISALKSNDLDKLENNIFNDLTKSALGLNSNLYNLYNELKKGARIHLSGSGPTIFGLNLTKEEKDYIKNNIPNDAFYYEGYIG